MHQLMNRLSDQVLRTGTQQTGRRRDWQIGTRPLAVNSADAICNRTEQDLLLAAQLFGTLPFPGPGQHLCPVTSGDGFHGAVVSRSSRIRAWQ